MTRQVRLSTYSITLTILLEIIYCFFLYIFIQRDDMWCFYILTVVLIIYNFLGLLYMPLKLSVDDRAVYLQSSLRVKKIPLERISSIRICPPTMSAHRILCSGGFLGYWGWFSESDIGKYFAYYGKASDCFLVTLKNGKKYMLGCSDPVEIVDFINAHISKASTTA